MIARASALVLLSLATLAGCNGGSSTPGDADEEEVLDAPAEPDAPDPVTDPGYEVEWPEPPWMLCTGSDEPAGATVITAFDLADHYYNPEDRRTIEAAVDFPTEGTWQAIGMLIDLTCPADGDCDNWDRFANVLLVENPGTLDEEAVELERYITPYNVGMCIVTNVTRFAPRLRGTQTIRSFISTWVGPDEPVHGHGWRITIKFIFHPGIPPSGMPEEVIQIWPHTSVVVGDPATSVADQLPPLSVPIPMGTTRAEVRVIATAHGQGNAYNCAEFCNLHQHVLVGSSDHSYDPWRPDCGTNPLGPLQSGTWTFNRSGWCPGAYVLPQVFDVTSDLTPGSDATFAYDILTGPGEIYENTCRPGAGGTDNHCTGCAFDDTPGNCDYDGGMHTQPRIMVTAQLMLYR